MTPLRRASGVMPAAISFFSFASSQHSCDSATARSSLRSARCSTIPRFRRSRSSPVSGFPCSCFSLIRVPTLIVSARSISARSASVRKSSISFFSDSSVDSRELP